MAAALRTLQCAGFALTFWLAPPPGSAQRSTQPIPAPAVRSGAAPTETTERHAESTVDISRVPPRAAAYHSARRLLSLGGSAWRLLGIVVILTSGLSVRLRASLYRLLRCPTPVGPPAAPSLWATALFFAAFTLLLTLWSTPAAFASLLVEREFGFARQSGFGLLRDLAVTYGLGLLEIPVYWIGYRVLARSPRNWWIRIWALLLPLMLFDSVLSPVLTAPAYNHFTPLPAGPLRQEILLLAQRAGITGGRVFVEDTSRRTAHVNAYVFGIGPTTRIVINDTALQTLPPDQILAMVGHEMGHYVEGHIWLLLAAGYLGAGAFLWAAARLLPMLTSGRQAQRRGLRGPLDLAALPLFTLLLALFLLVQAPLENAVSRSLEHRADAFGLRITGRSDAAVRLFLGFAERDFVDPNPPVLLHWWFGSHPTLTERIAFARSFGRHPHRGP